MLLNTEFLELFKIWVIKKKSYCVFDFYTIASQTVLNVNHLEILLEWNKSELGHKNCSYISLPSDAKTTGR